MKIKIISGFCIAGFLVCSLAGMAQSLPATAEGTTEPPAVDLGFGIVRSFEKLTASTYTITAEELEQTSAVNLQDALYGRLLGLTALKNNGGFVGDEDYGASFNIRSEQTLGERSVVILVDGLERPIDRLTVEEVESVTVLKDAAAVALYGYRGINGIISVKTKRGSTSGFSITASYDHKYTFDPMIADFVDAPTYADALNQARANDGLSPAYNAYEINAYRNGTDPLVYPNVDWRREALRNHGSENRANLSFQGGNENIKYFTLLNYTDSRGLLNHTDSNDGYSTQLRYSKANIRSNLDFKLTPTTLMQVNVQGVFYESSRPNGVNANDVISSLYSIPSSAFPVKMMDGETEKWGGNATYGGGNLRALIEGTGWSKNHSRSLYADAKITQDLKVLLPGLSASMRLGYDNYSNIREDRSRGFEYASERFTFDANGGKLGSTIYRAGNKADNLTFARELQSQFRRGNFAFTLDWQKQYGEHDLAASAIYSTQTSSFDERHNTVNRANWAAYMHYGYDDRYIADVALVVSGSSRSYPEKFAFSPTASFAWVVSNEEFLKGNSTIDMLKLRASAGILHSDYVPRTGIGFEDYSGGAGNYFVGYNYSEQWGTFLAYIPTTSFKLETAYKYNVGIDLSMFKGLNLTLDAYFQRRSNILLSDDGLNSTVICIPSSYSNKGVQPWHRNGIELQQTYAGLDRFRRCHVLLRYEQGSGSDRNSGISLSVQDRPAGRSELRDGGRRYLQGRAGYSKQPDPGVRHRETRRL